MLVLEDLHWADRSTLDLIALRSHAARVPGCVLVATFRSDEIHDLRAAARRARPLRTPPSASTSPASPAPSSSPSSPAILGTAPDYAVIEDVLARSEGNPFLAEELLAGGGRTGDILLARVAALSAGARRPALAPPSRTLPDARSRAVLPAPAAASPAGAASAGATPAAASPAPASPAPSPRTRPRSRPRVREALDHHVLVRAPGGAYAFRHALTREALYATLLAPERERLHRALRRDDRAVRRRPRSPTRRTTGTPPATGRGRSPRRSRPVSRSTRSTRTARRSRSTSARSSCGTAPSEVAGLTRVELLARAAEAASCLGEPARGAALIERALAERDDPVLRERLGALRVDRRRHRVRARRRTSRPRAPSPRRARAHAAARLARPRAVHRQRLPPGGRGVHGDRRRRAARAGHAGRRAGEPRRARRRAGAGARGPRAARGGRHRARPDVRHLLLRDQRAARPRRSSRRRSPPCARASSSMRRHGMDRNHRSWLEGLEAHRAVPPRPLGARPRRWSPARSPAGRPASPCACSRSCAPSSPSPAATSTTPSRPSPTPAPRPAATTRSPAASTPSPPACTPPAANAERRPRAASTAGLAALRGLDDLPAAARLHWAGLRANLKGTVPVNVPVRRADGPSVEAGARCGWTGGPPRMRSSPRRRRGTSRTRGRTACGGRVRRRAPSAAGPRRRDALAAARELAEQLGATPIVDAIGDRQRAPRRTG